MATAFGPPKERNQEATVYVGNLDQQVNEDMLWELFLQCGPVVSLYIPRDRVTQEHSGYGFVEFRGEEDAEYSMKVMSMVPVFGKPIKVNKASEDKNKLDVGANLFVGNLGPEVDEKLLYDAFSTFGYIIQPPMITRDLESGESKGYGFISYNNFEAADSAVQTMNGQFVGGSQIQVSYAFKKDSKGEKHGTEAERLLAANNPNRFSSQMTAAPPVAMNLPPPPM